MSLSTHFENLLNIVSSPTRIAFLQFEDRWNIFLETLLGHPRICGDNRPKDYPMAQEQKYALELSGFLGQELVTSKQFHDEAAPLSYTIYDWLLALGFLVLNQRSKYETRNKREAFFLKLLHFVIEEISHNFEDGNEFKKHALIRFGLPEEIQKEKKKEAEEDKETKPLKELLDCAMTAASFSLLSSDLPDQDFHAKTVALKKKKSLGKIRKDHADDLAQCSFNYIQVKAKGIQDFLDRCKYPYMRRGASAWCSQTLSLLRDNPEEWLNGVPMITTDSNAILTLAMPFDEKDQDLRDQDLARKAEDCLRKSVESAQNSILDDAFPMLKPWRKQALKETSFNSSARSGVYPNLFISIKKLNLLEICIMQRAFRTQSIRKDLPNVVFQEKDYPVYSPECFGRKGDPAYTDEARKIPPNYQPKGSGYGWPAAAYGLAGKNYRTTVEASLARELEVELELRPIKRRESSEREITEADRNKRALVKIDGDQVSKIFIEKPILRKTITSLELERNLRYRFVQAVKAIVKKYKCPSIPVDLVYFGGDDLEFTIAEKYVEDFATALQSKPFDSPKFSKEIEQLTYSMAILLYREGKGRSNIEKKAKKYINHLLTTCVKRKSLGGKRPDEKEISHLLMKQKFNKSIRYIRHFGVDSPGHFFGIIAALKNME